MEQKKSDDWLFEITPKNNFFKLHLKEVWQYRDLLMLFVKRDIVTLYKQTILGPLWYLIQPLFTSVIFTIVFNNVAGIKTGTVPPFLFNLASITAWNYFSSCLQATSDTFKTNASLFGKVYFPRIIMPLSIVMSNLLKFSLQLIILIAFYVYYVIDGYHIQPNPTVVFFPIIILLMGLLGLGFGMIISSMVTKYRDLTFLVTFGIQLMMYVSAVNYPIALIKAKMPAFSWIVEWNPMAYIIETTRWMLLSTGSFSVNGIIYTTIFSISTFFVGLLIFNKAEKSFIDTV
ncbi:ABC transporter permease [Flavobacterium magnum]|uniref:Transport permease protein n=1 Tax=Flavobacterium magnum TaxID=2162713 RepID=A0A2S0RDL1_9FLAO|nr:ABC transporter permease [Flavobacterium magnum]AWA29766.1 ABC transporter permease [Flavobacterium magnum]